MKRKSLIKGYTGRGWGRFTCQVCGDSIISYNDVRHNKSQRHKDNLVKNNAIQITHDIVFKFHNKGDRDDYINEYGVNRKLNYK